MFDAVSYHPESKQYIDFTGKQLIGFPCPTCGSSIVERIRDRDGTRFAACDKTNKPYCKFSIGIHETLRQRTLRIYYKLMEEQPYADMGRVTTC
jgi:ssDNA-binding Zn-finger/Zn-ribbon topoisomerase 1